jgi:autotransporter-associated beta strand protein
MWDQMPEVAGQSLTLNAGMTATAAAQSGDFTYTTSNGAVTITGYTGAGGAVEIPAQIDGMPVTAIGMDGWWFRWETSPTNITIPVSVTSISDSIFSFGCNLLHAIAVDEANPAYASVDGILYDKSISLLIQCPAGKNGLVSIPSNVTSIGFGAFSFCVSLTSLSIPASVTSIGGWAFKDCTALEAIALPASVVHIGENAFAHCTLLSSVSVDSANPVYAAVEGVLYDKALSTLIQWPKGKTGVASMPASVTTIGNYALFDCIGITSITVPTGVSSIGSWAFWNCSGLTSVFIPASLTGISDGAFSRCNGLTSVTIPAGVTSIGSSAFGYCNKLRSMYFTASPPSPSSYVFDGTPLTVYRLSSATGWSSTYGGRPVEIFQPVDIPSGQTATPSISVETSRVVKQGAGTAILSTTSTRTSGTVVEAGELIIGNKGAIGTGSLAVQAGAKAMLQIGYETVAVTSLSLADTARLEIGTGKLAVAANGFTESDIRTKLIAGRNGGSWDGASGITSTFAGGDRAIGYRVADGTLEVAYAAPGDSNLDGVFDILDIGDILSAGKFNTEEPANWMQGDVNYDNVFDIVDLADILGTNLFNEGTYLTQASASSAAVESGTVATFDPALVFAAFAMDSGGPSTTKRKSF